MKAMILAAGRGERMRPLTDTQPKPLLSVGGKPLIQRHIDKLVGSGIRDIVVNGSWLAAQLADFLGDGARFGARVQLSVEARALEAAGGVRRALPLLGTEPFLLVNGDIWTDFELASLAREPLGDRLGHLVLVPNPGHHPDGDFALNAAGRLAGQTGPRYTFAGISVLSPRLFAGLSEGAAAPLAPLLRAAAAQISGEVYRGRWFDVGTPARLAEIDALLRNAPCQEVVQ